MSTGHDRFLVRVVHEIAVLVAAMPVIDDECGRTRPQMSDVVVQRLELLGDRTVLRVVVVVAGAEPILCSLPSTEFAVVPVDVAVGQAVGVARCGHLRIAIERGQGRYRTIEAVVAATRCRRSTVVDQSAIGMGSRVGTDGELVAVPERILDIVLVGRHLDTCEPLRSLRTEMRGIVEEGIGVGVRDIVTDLAQVGFCERRVVAECRHQAELHADVVGQSGRVVVVRPAFSATAEVPEAGGAHMQIRVVRIVGEDHIDQDAVAAEQARGAVERGVGGVLGVGHQTLQVLR